MSFRASEVQFPAQEFLILEQPFLLSDNTTVIESKSKPRSVTMRSEFRLHFNPRISVDNAVLSKNQINKTRYNNYEIQGNIVHHIMQKAFKELDVDS